MQRAILEDGTVQLRVKDCALTSLRLREVHILVASKFVDLMANVTKLFSRTGELIQVYSDVSRFEATAARLVPGLKQLPPPTP